MTNKPFPENVWYAAASSRELSSGDVIARTLCNLPVAIFRDSHGKVGILLDRCPHRLFPLSQGKVTGNGIRCHYHGLEFNQAGLCESIPTQAEIPASACVRAFPSHESHGLIWFWPGDPELAADTPLPGFPTGDGHLVGLDFSCLDPSDLWGSTAVHRIHVEANYMLAVDNLLDLTHAAFLHAGSFENQQVLNSHQTVKVLGEKHLTDFFAFETTVGKNLRFAYMPDEGTENFDLRLETYWEAPSNMILVHSLTPAGKPKESDGTIICNVNLITPETDTTCHYFWAQSVYRNHRDGVVRDRWEELTGMVFEEDKAALLLQQRNLDRFGVESLDGNVALVLKVDKAIVLARRMVTKQIRMESDRSTQAAA